MRVFNVLMTAAMLVTVSSAIGTPPDVMTSNLVMLGASDSVIVFLVETGFNHGSHYLWEARWFLLAMDLRGSSFQWQEMGSVMHADDEFGGTQFASAEEEATIPGFLERWECHDALDFRGQSWREPMYDLTYFVSNGTLFLSFEGDSMPVAGARFFDPVRLAVMGTEHERYFVPQGGSPVREVHDLESLPGFFDFSLGRMDLSVSARATLGQTCLFIVEIPDEVAPFEVILTIPADEHRSALDLIISRH